LSGSSAARQRSRAGGRAFPRPCDAAQVLADDGPWTIAAGRMTLKLERKAIEGAFAKEIAGIYAK
jgi:hypothetical protein